MAQSMPCREGPAPLERGTRGAWGPTTQTAKTPQYTLSRIENTEVLDERGYTAFVLTNHTGSRHGRARCDTVSRMSQRHSQQCFPRKSPCDAFSRWPPPAASFLRPH
jgi:hypothetical protein